MFHMQINNFQPKKKNINENELFTRNARIALQLKYFIHFYCFVSVFVSFIRILYFSDSINSFVY